MFGFRNESVKKRQFRSLSVALGEGCQLCLKKIDYDKAAKMLFSRTEHYADNVRRLYATATDELLKLSAMKASNGVSAAFSFSDSKRLSEQANAILRALYSGVYNEIKGGVIAEWGNANKSCDALITSIFGKKSKRIITMRGISRGTKKAWMCSLSASLGMVD